MSGFTINPANRPRQESPPPTIEDIWCAQQVQPFFRHWFGDKGKPNKDFGPDFRMAAFINKAINDFDTNPGMIHELIFAIANSGHGHEGLRSIAQNKSLVMLLLVRHFENHGGLVLPPLKEARDAQEQWRLTVNPLAGEPRIRYPRWNPPQEFSADPSGAVPFSPAAGSGSSNPLSPTRGGYGPSGSLSPMRGGSGPGVGIPPGGRGAYGAFGERGGRGAGGPSRGGRGGYY